MCVGGGERDTERERDREGETEGSLPGYQWKAILHVIVDTLVLKFSCVIFISFVSPICFHYPPTCPPNVTPYQHEFNPLKFHPLPSLLADSHMLFVSYFLLCLISLFCIHRF